MDCCVTADDGTSRCAHSCHIFLTVPLSPVVSLSSFVLVPYPPMLLPCGFLSCTLNYSPHTGLPPPWTRAMPVAKGTATPSRRRMYKSSCRVV